MFNTRHSVFKARRLAAYTYPSRPSRSHKERANLSFLLVLMFFGVFGVIVLTEILMVDERGRGQGVLVRHGAPTRQRAADARPDYDEPYLPGDDYLQYVSMLQAGGGAPGDRAGVGLQGGAAGAGRHGAALPGAGAGAAGEQRVHPQAAANLTAKDGDWQIVSGTRFKFLVFSAFFDKRDGNRMIRVVGATKTRLPERVFCRYWYPEGQASGVKGAATDRSVTVPAKVKVIRENWNLKYSACFVLCLLKPNQTVPQSVSVVARLRVRPHNMLAVRQLERPAGAPALDPNSLAVCVKPLHFNYNRPVEMLEFLELNTMLGAEHFTFYNHTIGPQVSCILQDYAARGRVTLLPWHLNMASQREIRTEGLFAALNDCMYRNMNRHALVAQIDLDEYIVPRHNLTLPDLLQWLGKRLNIRTAGSFSFQNAFFYLQWPDDPLVDRHGLDSRLLTARKTTRRTKLHPHKQRSKYIARPELVVSRVDPGLDPHVEAGNHFVWEFLPGHGAINVHPSAAILHHYRVCEFGGDDCVKSSHVVDRTAHRYKDRLAAQVSKRWALLREDCRLGDLFVPPPGEEGAGAGASSQAPPPVPPPAPPLQQQGQGGQGGQGAPSGPAAAAEPNPAADPGEEPPAEPEAKQS
ncbi:Beta-1,4-galactosyltransferase galt-1 [Frankliniella fusca]|uniref:Glycosyltransferase family 92 protein n=1 Tax=Frankliniella fusca TaxID=407009 RepID=A0AAE1HW52_9NEOP|nr:Beta-1,4-galactosyltransferase galt-1 [Frankliniella fusca]